MSTTHSGPPSTDLVAVPADRTGGDHVAAYVEAFLDQFVSDHTTNAYRVDLTRWLGWLADRGLHPLAVNRGAVLAWAADLHRQGDAEATRARRLSSVSSWYQYLIGIEKIENNPADIPKGQRPVVTKESQSLWLSTAQAKQLQEAADADSPRTSALVALLLTTGARVGEVLAADIEDITQQDGHPVLPITGKGRRRRKLRLPPSTYSRLGQYLATRDDVDLLPAVATSGHSQRRPLFATRSGGRLDRVQVRRDLKRLARCAGGDLAEVVDRLTPHALRHSWVSDLLAEGASLRDVQYAAGHQDPTTTERYDHGDVDPDDHPTYQRAAQVARGYRLNRRDRKVEQS